MSAPQHSVIISVYNEQEILPALFTRLYPTSARMSALYHPEDSGAA